MPSMLEKLYANWEKMRPHQECWLVAAFAEYAGARGFRPQDGDYIIVAASDWDTLDISPLLTPVWVHMCKDLPANGVFYFVRPRFSGASAKETDNFFLDAFRFVG